VPPRSTHFNKAKYCFLLPHPGRERTVGVRVVLMGLNACLVSWMLHLKFLSVTDVCFDRSTSSVLLAESCR